MASGRVDLNEAMAGACSDVPGLVRAALALVPDGLLLGRAGEGSAYDYEPLVRSAAACLSLRGAPPDEDEPCEFVEYAFVTDDEIIVIEAGRHEPRVALALACRREANLAFVVSSARAALARVERDVDLGAFDVR